MSAIDAPLCRLCHKPHWQRAGCDFGKDAKRALGIAQSESKSEVARRRGKPPIPGGSVYPVRDDTAKAPKAKRKKAKKK